VWRRHNKPTNQRISSRSFCKTVKRGGGSHGASLGSTTEGDGTNHRRTLDAFVLRVLQPITLASAADSLNRPGFVGGSDP